MSNYKNFVSDFPDRCADLLRNFSASARHRNREVTLMLSIATSSIIVPLERLDGPKNGPKGYWPGHPSHDWERFQAAKASLDELLDKPFIGSPLWPKPLVNSWFSNDLADV